MDRNKYICVKCHRSIVTRYDNVGTTPFMLRCRATPGCDGMMQSQFGNVSKMDSASHEWFLRTDFERMEPDELMHAKQGGAFIRRIDEEVDPLRRKRRPNPLSKRRRR
jgi:hypothetical protein